MDILQWLKSDHIEMHRLLDSLNSSLCGGDELTTAIKPQFQKFVRHLLGHLKAELDFVLPELADRFVGADLLTDLCHANHRVIVKSLKDLNIIFETGDLEAIKEALAKVSVAVHQHSEVQEIQLLTKIRQSVPTSEREDIGQLVADFLQDYYAEPFDIAKEIKYSQNVLKVETNTRARA